MTTWIRAIVFLLALPTFLSAQIDLSQLSMPDDPSMRSVLRGRAFYEDSGAPIRRGRIGLVRIDDENFPVDANLLIQNDLKPHRWFYTGDDGSFEFRNIKAGKYYVAVDVPNVLSPQSVNAYFGGHRNVSKKTLDELFTTVELDGMNELIVSVPVKRGASISGFVRHSDQTSLVTGKINLFRISDSPYDPQTTVKVTEPDDRGYFRFTDLLPGKYFVSVQEFVAHRDSFNNFLSDDDYDLRDSEIETFYPNVVKLSDAKTISVGWGTAVDNIQIITPDRNLHIISGTVIDSDTGSPRAGAAVEFERIADLETDSGFFDGNLANRMNTNKDGTFLFKDLPPGQYRLRASCVESYLCNNSQYGDLIKTIDLSSGDIRNLKMELPIGATMSGTMEIAVTENSPRAFWIFLTDPKTKLRFQTTVRVRPNQKPVFTFNGINEGDYLMALALRDDDADQIVDKILVGNQNRTNEPISIRAGQKLDNVRIILTKNFSVFKGEVVQERNVPVVNTLVILYPAETERSEGYANIYNATTNKNGEFEIKAVAGEYYIVLPDKERDQNPNEDERMEEIRRTSTKISLEENKTTKMTLRMPKEN